jgi:hypothetical protein
MIWSVEKMVAEMHASVIKPGLGEQEFEIGYLE